MTKFTLKKKLMIGMPKDENMLQIIENQVKWMWFTKQHGEIAFIYSFFL